MTKLAPIHKVCRPVRFNEPIPSINTAAGRSQLMIVGVAAQEGVPRYGTGLNARAADSNTGLVSQTGIPGRNDGQKIVSIALALPLVSLTGMNAQQVSSSVPLAQRIAHTIHRTFHHLPSVHNGAVSYGRNAAVRHARPQDVAKFTWVQTFFFIVGVIPPKEAELERLSQHCEEDVRHLLMGVAQFTIEGATSCAKAMHGASNTIRAFHAIYIRRIKAVQWMNIKHWIGARFYDAFNLDESVSELRSIPFHNSYAMNLDRSILKPSSISKGGTGTVQFPTCTRYIVFFSPWSYCRSTCSFFRNPARWLRYPAL